MASVVTKSEDDPLVTAAVLANRAGVSTRTIGTWAIKGIAVRGPNGRGFRLWASIRNAFQELRRASAGRATISADRQLLLRAQTAKIQFENSVARGTHTETVVWLRLYAESLQRLRDLMLAVPDRLGSRLPNLSNHDRHEIDQEIRAAIIDSFETEKACLDSEDQAERDANDDSKKKGTDHDDQ